MVENIEDKNCIGKAYELLGITPKDGFVDIGSSKRIIYPYFETVQRRSEADAYAILLKPLWWGLIPESVVHMGVYDSDDKTMVIQRRNYGAPVERVSAAESVLDYREGLRGGLATMVMLKRVGTNRLSEEGTKSIFDLGNKPFVWLRNLIPEVLISIDNPEVKELN